MFDKLILGVKMNNKEAMILRLLQREAPKKLTQRGLAEKLGLSLGSVNKNLKNLKNNGYLDDELKVSPRVSFEKPKRAVILAAGFGMRMVPINTEIPKGLLEVKGQPLIERIIRQLHAVNVTKITVVVGFMKERYEYLIDTYGVELCVNQHYADKKNLYSLALASDCMDLGGTYIIPCDVYATTNPFSQYELKSWYLISQEKVYNTDVTLSRDFSLKKVGKGSLGNKMIGITYVDQKLGAVLAPRLQEYVNQRQYAEDYWEVILEEGANYLTAGLVVAPDEVMEINTYEELRELDSHSNQLNNELLSLIASVLGVAITEIKKITLLKKGMTNRSFEFTCQGKRYIMRVPGKGTSELINRRKEAQIYRVLAEHDIGEKVLYINENNGYKLTEFIEGARNSNPYSQVDLTKCMELLRKFHGLELEVDFTFDLFEKIDFYENLRNGPSNYRDYAETKAKIWRLKIYLDGLEKKSVLCHIDANADNFLLKPNGEVVLIDWEYAAMQDPDVDIAMNAIYAMYQPAEIDNLIDTYYQGKCSVETRRKIYAYIAVCGLLWSNWCEYKNSLGIDFGEYSLRQYRYAKEYSRLVLNELEEEDA